MGLLSQAICGPTSGKKERKRRKKAPQVVLRYVVPWVVLRKKPPREIHSSTSASIAISQMGYHTTSGLKRAAISSHSMLEFECRDAASQQEFA